MTHSHQADVNQVIGVGISLIHELVQSPQHLLGIAFEKASLYQGLQLHHAGLLAPLCSHADISSSIEAHGLKVVSVFPSAVVAVQLSKRFGKEVRVDIYRTCPINGGSQALEVFRVVDGLEAGDINAAMPDVLHVAFAPDSSVDIGTLCKQMAEEGFEYAGGGVNYDDVKLTRDGITVLYFRNRILNGKIPKIELVLQGAQSFSDLVVDADSFAP